MSRMARKQKPPTDRPPEQPEAKGQKMQGTASKAGKGTGHRPRVMVALRPAIYELLTAYAKKQRRAASWELHNIILQHLVQADVIDQARADELWDDVIGGKADADDEGG